MYHPPQPNLPTAQPPLPSQDARPCSNKNITTNNEVKLSKRLSPEPLKEGDDVFIQPAQP